MQKMSTDALLRLTSNTRGTREKYDPAKAESSYNNNIRTKTADKANYAHVKSKFAEPTKSMVFGAREKADLTPDPKDIKNNPSYSPRSPRLEKSTNNKYADIQSKFMEPTAAAENGKWKPEDTIRPNSPVRRTKSPARFSGSPNRGGSPRKLHLETADTYEHIQSKLMEPTKATINGTREKVIAEKTSPTPFSKLHKNVEIPDVSNVPMSKMEGQSRLHEPTIAAIQGAREKAVAIDGNRWNVSSHLGDSRADSASSSSSPSKDFANVQSRFLSPTKAAIHGSRNKAEALDPREVGWGHKHEVGKGALDDPEGYTKRPQSSAGKYNDTHSKLLEPTLALVHGSRAKVEHEVDPREQGFLTHIHRPAVNNDLLSNEIYKEEELTGSPKLYKDKYEDINSKLMNPTAAAIAGSREKAVETESRVWNLHRPRSHMDVREQFEGRELPKTRSSIDVRSRLNEPTTAYIAKIRLKAEIDTTREQEIEARKDYLEDIEAEEGAPRLYPHSHYQDISSKLREPTAAATHSIRGKHELDHRTQGWNSDHSGQNNKEAALLAAAQTNTFSNVPSKLFHPTAAIIHGIRAKADASFDPDDMKNIVGGKTHSDVMDIELPDKFASVHSKLLAPTAAQIAGQRDKAEVHPEDNAFTISHDEGETRLDRILSLPRPASMFKKSIHSKLLEPTLASIRSQVDEDTKQRILALPRVSSSSTLKGFSAGRVAIVAPRDTEEDFENPDDVIVHEFLDSDANL